MKKKLTQLRWLVTMLLFVTAFAMPKMAWAEITPTKPSGDGTSAKPYQIGTAEELYWFAALVNGDTSVDGVAAADKAACAELTTNITVNSGVLKSDGSLADEANSFTAWTPISVDDGNPYIGTFDGKGYTICGLYFNDTSGYYIGLFGYVGSGSKIYNVGIVDSYFKGDFGIGGVCGYCISSGEITNCYNTGTVIGTINIGGVCGYNSGTITNCYNTGNVSGTSTSNQEGRIGGVCGINTGNPNMGTITRSYNSGKVSGGYYVGGVCGANGSGYDAQIINCYNTGEVTGTKDDVGGICGYNNKYIEKCYNSAAVSGGSYVGSVCGFNGSSSVITTCYYLSGIAAGGINNSDVSGSAESKTAEQFASGEVALLLNGGKTDGSQAWYQKLGENGDASPLLTATGKNTVYHGTKCDKITDVYTNDNSIFGEDGAIPHNYEIADRADDNGLYGDVCTECNANNESVKYIQNFCGEWGNNVKLSVEADGSYQTADVVKFNDANTYDSPVDFTAHKLEYTREYLGDNKWQAVYVPFETQATDWSDNGITVASINNFHEYEKEDGSGYETVLEVKKATSGVFEANTPYVIRSGESGNDSKTITIANVKLYKAESKNYYCMSMTRKYDFTGIYTPQNGLGQDESAAVYALDKQGRIAPLKSETTLGAQRWYLTVSDRNGSSLPQDTKSRTIRIDMIGEGATTGIKDVQVITSNETDNIAKAGIYDLQGHKLSKESTHGIYIKNGKKYVK